MATRRWSSKTMRIRSGLFCGSIYWVLLVSGRVSVPKPLSQIQRSTRWLLQGLSPRTSFGGFGFRSDFELTVSHRHQREYGPPIPHCAGSRQLRIEVAIGEFRSPRPLGQYRKISRPRNWKASGGERSGSSCEALSPSAKSARNATCNLSGSTPVHRKGLPLATSLSSSTVCTTSGTR